MVSNRVERQNTLPENSRGCTLGDMTASPRAAHSTARETVALNDASHPVVHVEFRIGDPHRQAKVRAVMDRLRVGNRFGNR